MVAMRDLAFILLAESIIDVIGSVFLGWCFCMIVLKRPEPMQKREFRRLCIPRTGYERRFPV